MIDQDYQLLPDLAGEEWEAFLQDVRHRGVLVPIELDETGKVLDGHQRLRAVAYWADQDVKIDYQVVVRGGLSEDDKFAHSLGINLQRRQLSMEQKRELSVELRLRFPWSTAKIGRLLGVNQSTIVRWHNDFRSDGGQLPDRVEGDDGKPYKSQVWGGIYAPGDRGDAAVQAAALLGGRERSVDIRRALVLARQARLDAPLVEQQELAPDTHGEVELRLGPLTEALADLEDESVDLILTDPPYPQEFLPQWWELAELAGRVLKPGRLLVAYCGHRWLDQCFNALQSHLDYAWLGGLWFGGPGPSVHDRQVFSGWRPILMFSRGEWEPRGWTKDAWAGAGQEKDLHPWQQAVTTFLDLVEAHSQPGELVVDPFLGSGTTAVAAVQLARRFIGCDVDPGAVRTARERLGF